LWIQSTAHARNFTTLDCKKNQQGTLSQGNSNQVTKDFYGGTFMKALWSPIKLRWVLLHEISMSQPSSFDPDKIVVFLFSILLSDLLFIWYFLHHLRNVQLEDLTPFKDRSMIFWPMQVCQYQFAKCKFANWTGWQTCIGPIWLGELVLANLHWMKDHGIHKDNIN